MNWRQLLRICVNLALLGAVIGWGAGYLGRLHSAFDTLSNFRLHIFWVMLGALPLIILLRFKREAVMALIIAMAALWGARAAIPHSGLINEGPTYSLISYNMLFENDQRRDVVPWLIGQDADILFVTEFSRFWAPLWEPLIEHYPHHSYCPEWQGTAGNYLFSKYPLDLDTLYCQDYAAFHLVEADIAGQKIILGGTHLRWPWPASGPEQITQALPVLENLGDNALLIGDFNSVPWSYSMQRISEAGDLNIYQGIGASWLFTPFPDWFRKWFGLPIDNAMQKGAVQITAAERLPSMGSDHMPIKFEISINR